MYDIQWKEKTTWQGPGFMTYRIGKKETWIWGVDLKLST